MDETGDETCFWFDSGPCAQREIDLVRYLRACRKITDPLTWIHFRVSSLNLYNYILHVTWALAKGLPFFSFFLGGGSEATLVALRQLPII